MRKSLLWLSSAVGGFLLLLSSCSQVNGVDSVEPIVATGQSNVRFFISFPSEDPVVFTRAIQSQSEIAIEQIDVYQFSGATGSEFLEEVYPEQKFTSIKDGASMTLQVKGTGVKHFLFVVNNKTNGRVPSIINPRIGMSLDEFSKQVTESTEGGLLTSPLLMVAMKRDVEVKEDGTDHQSVDLERIMARLDIKNYEPYLQLKRVRLEGVNDRSFIMHQVTGSQTPTGNKVITLPEVNLPVVETPAGSDPAVVMERVAERQDGSGVILEAAHTHYKHVYYPYVSDVVTDATKAPVLIIEGTLFPGDPEREHDVVYKKVLKLDDATGSDHLGFQRNHRYTVAIKGGTIPGKADIKLYVNQWNLVELPIEEVEVKAPTLSMIPHYIYIFKEGDNKFDIVANTFTQASHVVGTPSLATPKVVRRYDIPLCVHGNTDWEVVVGSQVIDATDSYTVVTPWLSIRRDATDYWLNVDNSRTFAGGLRLNFTTANDTGVDREVTIVLRSKVDPTKRTEWRIIQSGKEQL